MALSLDHSQHRILCYVLIHISLVEFDIDKDLELDGSSRFDPSCHSTIMDIPINSYSNQVTSMTITSSKVSADLSSIDDDLDYCECISYRFYMVYSTSKFF